MKEFVLPEKWAIKRDKENYWVINDWANNIENNTYPYYTSKFDYIHGDKPKNCKWLATLQEGYTEITFEQFKKYVLKQEIPKLIGYKLKNDKYLSIITGLLFLSDAEMESYYKKQHIHLSLNHTSALEAIKSAGILEEWFEPVYKKNETVLTLGSNNKKIVVTDKIICDDKTYDYSVLDQIYTHATQISTNKIGGYNVKYDIGMRFIKIGCESEGNAFSLSEIKQALDAYKEINK